jgi:hypothetical protein
MLPADSPQPLGTTNRCVFYWYNSFCFTVSLAATSRPPAKQRDHHHNSSFAAMADTSDSLTDALSALSVADATAAVVAAPDAEIAPLSSQKPADAAAIPAATCGDDGGEDTVTAAAAADPTLAATDAAAPVLSSGPCTLAAATGLSPEQLTEFTTRSSIGHPFLVLSSGGAGPFIDGVPACPPHVFERLVEGVHTWLASHSIDHRLVLLTDFEGEQPGFGGELSVAQFLQTNAVVAAAAANTDTAAPASATTSKGYADLATDHTAAPTQDLGLLVDMRDVAGAAVVATVMAAAHVTKLIWGADGDLTTLRHKSPGKGGIAPVASRSVVDVQLCFSPPQKRLGMATAMQSVPFRFLAGGRLPPKDAGGMDYRPRLKNRRCMPFPLSRKLSQYCADDLHRMEAILRSRNPTTSLYATAAGLTEETAAQLESPRAPLLWLEHEMRFYVRKYGVEKGIKGMEMYRGVLGIEQAFGASMNPADVRRVRAHKAALKDGLSVHVPDDLAFAE